MGSKFGIVRIICLATVFIEIVDSANIVFFFGVSTYSHRVAAWPLVESLADNGHNVTFISPHPAKINNSKIFDYNPNGLTKWIRKMGDTGSLIEERKKVDYLDRWLRVPTFGKLMCETLYSDEEFIKWVKGTKVDVVMLGALGNDCAYGMAHYWDAKVILFATSSPYGFFSESYGLADESSWIPSLELSNPIVMSFPQRLVNALCPLVLHYHRKWNFFPSLEAITNEKLGMSNVPKFEELERNSSLVFLNAHFGEEFARSLPPNVIPIGGITITGKRKALPKEMEAFLAQGDGFVYISFGTLIEFHKVAPKIQRAFIGAMRNLSHIQFLWKMENGSFINAFPQNNVYISSWMPQQDILAHPKIVAFITHAGLLGIQEAVYNSVPLISFPIFSDQDYNAERIHHREYGIRLEILDVTQSQIEGTIQKILTDPKYRNNMKKVSTMFTDRPQKPLETALWWTNFVIRHSKEDLARLRPSNVGQFWWKRRQLDVWVTILASVLALMSLCVYVTYIFLAKCAGHRFVSFSDATTLRNGKKIQ